MRMLLTGGSGFIGTQVIDLILQKWPAATLLNVDLCPPKVSEHAKWWRHGDILQPSALIETLKEFEPEIVIHLAARTDPDGKTLHDYRVNTIGTANLRDAIKRAGSVGRSIFFSTQYVCGPGPLPTSDEDYRPVNTYGESKAVMEQAIRRDEAIPGIWTIVRPTNIWGPWHPRYPQEFWLVVKGGRYFHPGGGPVRRAYGYVGNVAEYVVRLLDKEPELIDRKVFYLGDTSDDVRLWAAAFTRALTGRELRTVPRPILKGIALVGDVVRLTGQPFPLFSGRFRSMTEDFLADYSATVRTLGPPAYSLDTGVQLTIEWLTTQGSPWTTI